MPITTIAFDGDDTLWHHENFFREACHRFHDYMNTLGSFPDAYQALDAKHINDIKLWGYGVKGLILTMIELAIQMTGGKITGAELQKIFDLGKETYQHPINLLPFVRETLTALHGRYVLLLITKGDLIAQEMKIAQSGLASLFDRIEIVTEKDEETYARIMRQHKIDPQSLVMVGNSIRSDILPPLNLGAQAVHVPYHVSWHFENPEIAETDQKKFIVLPSLEKLPEVIAKMA